MSSPDPSPLYHLEPDRPELVEPVLVLAPEGWIDAGGAGGAALSALASGLETRVVATFDTDVLLDHRARRPSAQVTDGVYTDLTWPTIELLAGSDERARDVLLLVGPEPDYQWQAYAGAVSELAGLLGVRLAVGLGAFPAPVPHTRAAPLAATATTAELANRVGVVTGTLEVPAGVLIVVQQRCAAAGIPALALWARVPYYAAAMPYPQAALRLVEGLADVAGLELSVPDLAEAAAANAERLQELVANSVEHQALLRRLEAQVDAESEGGAPPTGFGELPSGDELAAELERFLRQQEE